MILSDRIGQRDLAQLCLRLATALESGIEARRVFTREATGRAPAAVRTQLEAGGPPNAGWFASTGSSKGTTPGPANPRPTTDGLANPPQQQDQLAQVQPPAQGGPQANPPAAPPAAASVGLIAYAGGKPRLNPFGYNFKVTYVYAKDRASQVWAQKIHMTIRLWDGNGKLKVQHSSTLWDLENIGLKQSPDGTGFAGATDLQHFDYQALVAKAIDGGIARNALTSRLVAFEVEYRADQWVVPNKGITIATRDRGNVAYDPKDYADSRVALTATESYDMGQGLGVGANATIGSGSRKLGAGVTLPQQPAPHSSFSWKAQGTVLGPDRILQQSTGLRWNQAGVLKPQKLDEPPAALQEIKLAAPLWK